VSAGATPQLTRPRKIGYALGDISINTGLVALALVYGSFFLPQVAGIRPLYAGLIPLIGRLVDAVSDPLMGRLSDRTRSRWGRRRPYFLWAAVPYGFFFALLWSDAPFATQGGRFAYYAAIYCLFSLSVTVPSVPYVSIQPEMATGYDERTSLNTYRAIGSVVGALGALAMRPLADAFGGGSAGFARAGWAMGIALILPWLVVFVATFELPEFRERTISSSFRSSLRDAFHRQSFRSLVILYLLGRVAMDIAGAMLLPFTVYWMGRTDLFEPMMALFFAFVVVGLVLWRRLAEGREKASVFAVGCAWWMAASVMVFAVQPDWPLWPLYVFIPLVAIGYAVVDLMPWSMIGEVIDEDELGSGERREGTYNGVFTFVRKVGGSIGFALAMAILDAFGYEASYDAAHPPSEEARQAIRAMMAFGPVVFLAGAIWVARRYTLDRAAHQRIVAQLALRRSL